MAITVTEIQGQFSASDSGTVTSGGGTLTSDSILGDGGFDATAIEAMVHVKCDNAGTPAAGDTVDVYIRYTGGDPDGSGADEFDSAGHGVYLGTLDTNVEDPALASFPISVCAKDAYLHFVNNGASNVTASFCISEKRAA